MEQQTPKTAYITGTKSLKAIAAEFDMDAKSVYAAAEREKWSHLRAMYRAKQNVPEELSECGVPLLKKIGSSFLFRMDHMLSDEGEFRRNFVRETTDGDTIDMKTMKDFSSAYKEIARAILDLTNESGSGKGSGTNGVVLIPIAQDADPDDD